MFFFHLTFYVWFSDVCLQQASTGSIIYIIYYIYHTNIILTNVCQFYTELASKDGECIETLYQLNKLLLLKEKYEK